LREIARLFAFALGPIADEPTKRKIFDALLGQGLTRSENSLEQRGVKEIDPMGFYEVAAYIDGEVHLNLNPGSFPSLLESADPSFTALPPFLVQHRVGLAPWTFEGSWESLHSNLEPGEWGFKRLDFWRASPEGKFYLRRNYQEDDGTNGRKPHTFLDFRLAINRPAEIIETIRRCAELLHVPEETEIGLRFRCNDLLGRHLVSAISGGFNSPGRAPSQQASVTSETSIRVGASTTDDLVQATAKLIRPLFFAFGGASMNDEGVHAHVTAMVNRKW
jgi:hypothetical protein